MAISVDEGSVSGVQTSTTDPISWEHTVPDGLNRLLLVALNIFDMPGGPVTVPVPDTVTFGAANLTQADSASGVFNGADDGDVSVSYWYLVDPPVSTDTITVTYTGTENVEKGGFSVSLAGVDQVQPIGANASAGPLQSVDNISLNLETTADGSFVFDVLKARPSGLVSIATSEGPDQTNWGLGSTTFGTSFESAGTAPDTRTMSWDWSADPESDLLDAILMAVEIRAATGGPSRLLLLHARGDN